MTRELPQNWPDHHETPPPHGNLTPTTSRQVWVAVLSGAVLGWFVLSIYTVTDSIVPVLPMSTPIILAVIAVAVWVDSRLLAAKVADEKREVSPTEGLVSLALGKALVLTGAALGGASIVYVLANIAHLDIPSPRQRVVMGSVTVVVCALLSVSGWQLEKACRVPRDPDGQDA